MPTAKQNATPTTAESPTDRMEAFKLAKAVNNAPAWRADINPAEQVLDGTVFALSMGRDSGYGEYPVITYKLESPCGDHAVGEYINVHAFHTLLRQQLKDTGCKVGLHQMLSYDGKKKKNNPSEDEIARGLDEYHLTFVMNVGEEAKPVAEGFTF